MNRVIWATTIVLVPLGILVLVALGARDTPFQEAAQTATAGLVTLIPEGLVLLMSVTLAVAAVRLAKQNTLVQQMAATEALAAVDTICVDKTGTLTDGELELVAVAPADGAPGRGVGARPRPVRELGRRAQPDPPGDRRPLPRGARAGRRRGAVLLRLEVERRDAERERTSRRAT